MINFAGKSNAVYVIRDDLVGRALMGFDQGCWDQRAVIPGRIQLECNSMQVYQRGARRSSRDVLTVVALSGLFR